MLSAIASTHFAFLADMDHDPGAVLVSVPALSSPSHTHEDCEESCQQEKWTITGAPDVPMWWNPLGCSGSLYEDMNETTIMQHLYDTMSCT